MGCASRCVAAASLRDDVSAREADVNSYTTQTAATDYDAEASHWLSWPARTTEQIKSQERIERLATVDELTQLANRQTFDERAGRILANAYAGEKRCALLFIDLDNFRLLNNGYGHRVGDQMLSIVASRIRNAIAEPHLVGRRGGDELVALLVDIPHGEYAVEVAKELIRSISEPARVLGMEVSVTPSVGISFFPQDGIELDSLLMQRRRDVSGEGERAADVRVLHANCRAPRGFAAASGAEATQGGRSARFQACVSAADITERRQTGRRRGADSLARRRAGRYLPSGIYSDRRGIGADRRARRMGAARSLPCAARLAHARP